METIKENGTNRDTTLKALRQINFGQIDLIAKRTNTDFNTVFTVLRETMNHIRKVED